MWQGTEPGSVGDADGGRREQYASDRPRAPRSTNNFAKFAAKCTARFRAEAFTDIALFYCE